MAAHRKPNKTWTEGDVGYIEIISPTHGRYVAKVDADRLDEVKEFTWGLRWSHDAPRYVSSQARADGRQKTTLLQAFLFPNCPKELVRDHINGDGFDNRKSNIRFVSRSHNSLNLKHRKRKHGVQKNKHGNRNLPFTARLNLGMFKTEDDAHEAWKLAYVKVFGELPECVQ